MSVSGSMFRPIGLPSASSRGRLSEASATLEKVASYGNRQDRANEELREGIDIIERQNPALRQEFQWRAFLWRMRRHWAVVVQPDMGDEAVLARVDTDLLRKCAPAADQASKEVPVSSLFVVLELVVPPAESRDFYLQFCVYPEFDTERDGAQYIGNFGPLGLAGVAEKAIQVICHYRSYGIIGCNCQHFAVDLLQKLGLEAGSCVPDDQRAEEAAAWGVRAYSISAGIAKGVGGCAAVAATGAASAGAAVLSAHLVIGCAVGYVGGTAIHRGYKWLCQQHRREDAAGSVAPPSCTEDGNLPGVELTGGLGGGGST
mmetsp:Transcript_68919/g.213787  ORF Transcript_68919/g.213787 Transcript_68919/m.213787 type:complete len:316 (+) Transcript_68919:100-1047(+)